MKQNNKSEIRYKIIYVDINTKLIKKITLIYGHNFLDSTTPNKRDINIKNEISRFNEFKTCTYQFHEIILKNYRIFRKNYEIK